MHSEDKQVLSWSCPRPREGQEFVTLAHGGGGLLTHRLIKNIFHKAFSNDMLGEMNDAAVLHLNTTDRIAISTDSFVVQPMEFPGGDIGMLAVHGTVNDLAMMGAKPAYLTAGFILEEGLPLTVLERIVQSMANAARETGVTIVAGDTKVVDHGHGDGIFINTTGIGVYAQDCRVGSDRVTEDDCIIISGDLGRHGIAIMAARDNLTDALGFESDTCNLAPVVSQLMQSGIDIHWMRDLTRGGLSSAVNELVEAAHCGVHLIEEHIYVHPEVQGLCELLGLDPLYVANEGRFMMVLPEHDAEQALAILNEHKSDDYAQPSLIGHINSKTPGRVTLESQIGVERILDMMSGEQLPRIC